MVRRIIEIDRDKCNGCGACAEACHEGAIAMVDGKAQLMRDEFINTNKTKIVACVIKLESPKDKVLKTLLLILKSSLSNLTLLILGK